MGLSLITQFACSDDDKSGGNYNGPLKLTTFYPDSGYLSSKIIIEGENWVPLQWRMCLYEYRLSGRESLPF